MAEPKKVEIIVPRQGGARAVLSGDSARVLGVLGKTEARRASHVEPAAGLSVAAQQWLHDHPEWHQRPEVVNNLGRLTLDADIVTHIDGAIVLYADLTPVSGPVLGPFVDRVKAVEDEIAWLRDHGFPMPPEPPCRECKGLGFVREFVEDQVVDFPCQKCRGNKA